MCQGTGCPQARASKPTSASEHTPANRPTSASEQASQRNRQSAVTTALLQKRTPHHAHKPLSTPSPALPRTDETDPNAAGQQNAQEQSNGAESNPPARSLKNWDPNPMVAAQFNYKINAQVTAQKAQQPPSSAQAKAAVPAAQPPAQRPAPANVRAFVLKHYKEAQELANQIGNGVTAAEILAVSGNETGYGDKALTFTKDGNFFGLHGIGPAGFDPAKKDPNVKIQKFNLAPRNDGFMDSGQVFAKIVKREITTPGIGNDPKAFFNALHSSSLKYAADNPKYGAMMVENNPIHRGAYILVTLAIESLQKEGKL